MIRIVSVSHYFQPLTDDVPPPPLNDALREVCRVGIRRVDRFIQLALLGSARCAANTKPTPDCAIYLGSGMGPIGNNIETQQQLIRDAGTPKPVNFINTLGASAGFHVARNLEINGRNLFISRRGESFEAALEAAIADLSLGITRQALVGAVEESPRPLAAQRERQGLSDSQPLAEGSHWLLLESAREHGPSIYYRRYGTLADMEKSLQEMWRDGDRLYCSFTVSNEDAEKLGKTVATDRRATVMKAFHDSSSAARVAVFLTDPPSSRLFLAGGNNQRGWRLFGFGAQAPVD